MARGQVYGIIPSGGGAFIKSIQYGTVTITPTSVLTGTATISAVDTDNSYVIHNGEENSSQDGEWGDMFCYLVLTNGTTITATRNQGDNYSFTCDFCVVEYEDDVVKSKQSGVLLIPANSASATVTVSAVTKAKAMLVKTGQTTSSAATDTDEADENLAKITLTNNTTVTAVRDQGSGSPNMWVSWQLIDYN